MLGQLTMALLLQPVLCSTRAKRRIRSVYHLIPAENKLIEKHCSYRVR